MDTVAWEKFKFNENGDLYPITKTHFTEDKGDTTLCGRTVPSNELAASEGFGDKNHVECKLCQNKYNKIELAEKDHHQAEQNIKQVDRPSEATKEDIAAWLKKYPEIGALNNGVYYVIDPTINEYPYYRQLKALEEP
jgi:hypothetical protein